ncbi:MAG: NAD-dependent deacylase [Anaerolineales bacterium]|nr:NAD-dependent deacylase [Anaerolineales bacterium]
MSGLVYDDQIQETADLLRSAKRTIAFTGAGISVESGIPPFRGPDGLWAKYDPQVLSIDYFFRFPEEAWRGISEIFYKHFQEARPNAAHLLLARMEKNNLLSRIITQNIDGLHQKAGSTEVVEYHGSSQRLVCTQCGDYMAFYQEILQTLPPQCGKCGGLLKPDFIFFGEMIPEKANIESTRETRIADVWIVIGTTGEVVPASMLPWEAKSHKAAIVEINPHPSAYTEMVTDIFLQGTAVEIAQMLEKALF